MRTLQSTTHRAVRTIEVLPNEQGQTATAFAERALAWFASLGVRVERIMTDNGSAYRLVRTWAERGALRAGLSENEAADVMWAVSSDALYTQFVRELQRRGRFLLRRR